MIIYFNQKKKKWVCHFDIVVDDLMDYLFVIMSLFVDLRTNKSKSLKVIMN